MASPWVKSIIDSLLLQDGEQVDVDLELSLARNMFGRLKPKERVRIRRVVQTPTEENWDDASSIIVGANGWMTLWQAVCRVDPGFPKSAEIKSDGSGFVWSEIPTRETLIKALEYATH